MTQQVGFSSVITCMLKDDMEYRNSLIDRLETDIDSYSRKDKHLLLFHYSAIEPNMEKVKYLIDHGADTSYGNFKVALRCFSNIFYKNFNYDTNNKKDMEQLKTVSDIYKLLLEGFESNDRLEEYNDALTDFIHTNM